MNIEWCIGVESIIISNNSKVVSYWHVQVKEVSIKVQSDSLLGKYMVVTEGQYSILSNSAFIIIVKKISLKLLFILKI